MSVCTHNNSDIHPQPRITPSHHHAVVAAGRIGGLEEEEHSCGEEAAGRWTVDGGGEGRRAGGEG